MGRPKKIVNVELISELAGLNCSFDEISRIVGVSVRTLHRSYGTAIKKGRDFVTTSLKRKQFELAINGNITMLIWLGKNILDQTDKTEIKGDGKLEIVRKVLDVTGKEIKKVRSER
ncbi:MAG: hypothetical protein PF549_03335 [Patescibacteria group bacterium]|jgi:hypothetical protein|nr:hypothetical protein [Patescibacteria group bacterium]